MDDFSQDLTEVLQKLQRAKTFSKPWHDNIRRWRNLYDFNHYSHLPEATSNESRYKDPTYTNTVDLAVGIFQANEMIWRVTGWNPSVSEQRGSDNVEKYLAGLIDVNSDRNEYDIRFEVNQHFVRDGGAVVYSVWSPDIAATEREFLDEEEGSVSRKSYEEPPICVKVIDPLKINLLPGGPHRWLVVARCEERMVWDVEVEYGIRLREYSHLTASEKMETKCEFSDYWDISYEANLEPTDTYTGGKKMIVRNALLAAGQFVVPIRKMDGYDEIPYTVDFYKPTKREDSSGWHNILVPLESTVRELERNFNRVQRQIDVFSSLPMIARVGNRPLSIDPGMGNVLALNEGEDVMFPVWPGNAPDVTRQMEFLRSRIQQSGFSDVMFGSGSSSVSGYAISQLGDQNRIRLEQPVTHLQKFWSRWAKKVLKLTSKFGSQAAIRVYGRLKNQDFIADIRGDEVSGYSVQCEIRPEFPNEKVRNHAMASQVRGLISDHTIMQDYLGIQQPDEERKRMLIEAAQSNPVVLQYAVMVELERIVREGDEDMKIAAQRALDNMKSANQGGRPEEPPNPSQPMGLQSSTGEPPMQATSDMSQQDMIGAIQGMANASPNMMGGIGGGM